MNEPTIRVGIMSAERITAMLHGGYVIDGSDDRINGDVSAQYADGGILFNGVRYSVLRLTPVSESECFFTLCDVTIGVEFHWQRKEAQSFKGGIEFYAADGTVTVINNINAEEYLKSVISSEMNAHASLELLKAHAVISRSWLIAQISKKGTDAKNGGKGMRADGNEIVKWYDRDDHDLFDVCADDHCQRYQGITKAYIPTVKRAVEETRGEVLVSDGEICDARFSKCCGGATEEFGYCWEDKDVEYLKGVRDSADEAPLPDLTTECEAEKWIAAEPEAFCNTSDGEILRQILNDFDMETNDFYRWQVRYSQQELSDIVRERSGIDFGTIELLTPLERGVSGRISRLRIDGSKRSMIIGKELEIRKTLSRSHLYSSAFTVKRENGDFVIYGAGWGHGVGLCQIGAAVMGSKGYGYREILAHYYKGARVEAAYN